MPLIVSTRQLGAAQCYHCMPLSPVIPSYDTATALADGTRGKDRTRTYDEERRRHFNAMAPVFLRASFFCIEIPWHRRSAVLHVACCAVHQFFCCNTDISYRFYEVKRCV